jgi:hypothetical protein
MPRVYTKTKSTRGKVYRCQSCGQDIEPGQDYYEWSRRFGRSGQTYRQHTACGRPKPTQLSSRKTAVLEEAVNEIDFSGWSFDIDYDSLDAENGGEIDIDTSGLEAMVEEIADVAREIGEEYQSGFDNMPEGLQQGPTAQAMEEVAQELESWADDLASSIEDGSVEYPSIREFHDNEDDEDADADALRQEWIEHVEQLVQDKMDELRQAAEDACSEYPEYQG